MSVTLSQITESKLFRRFFWGGVLLAVVGTLFVYRPADGGYVLLQLFCGTAGAALVIAAVDVLLVGWSCFLLMRLNNKYALMQQRTLLPVILLLLFDCCNPAIVGTINSGLLLTPVYLSVIYLLYDTYQNENCRAAYDMGLLLAVGYLVEPPFLLLSLPFCFGFIYMRSSSWRMFAALGLGVLTVIWLVFCIGLTDDCRLLPDFHDVFLFASFVESGDLRYFLPITVIGILCGVGGTYFIKRHKIQIWRYNRFTLLLTIFLLALSLLDMAALDAYLPLLNATMALSVSNFALHTRSRAVPYLFYVLIGVYFVLYAWNLCNF